jgi:hypothetical protein
MHKKLDAELVSLAHQILQIKNKEDVIILRDRAKDVYEKLSVLAFVDNYFSTTPNASENKAEILEALDNAKSVNVVKEDVVISEKDIAFESEKLIQQTEKTIKSEASKILEKIQKEDLVAPIEDVVTVEHIEPKTEVKKSVSEIKPEPEVKKITEVKQPERATLEEELKDSIPADVAANLFEKMVTLPKKPEPKKETIIPEKIGSLIPPPSIPEKKEPVKIEPPKSKVSSSSTTPSKSLNDRIFQQKLQIGLNDRIAFVKHLFNFSQEDFNRVLSQLNTFETEQECKDFLINRVKPDYDWSGQEAYEERLLDLIERKFL